MVLYRIGTAKENLRAAQILLEAGEYKSANNRAYYAIFHFVNAVHALAGNAYKRHKDAIANFNKDYVKTEIFPKEIGRRIAGAETIRYASDYYMLFIEHNYFIYRITDEMILEIFNEKEDFMRQMFGIVTTSQDTIDYWGE